MIQETLLFLLKTSAIYFVSINMVYGGLLILSWFRIRSYSRNNTSLQQSKELPPLSFVIPAYNEESLIVETIQTYLSLENIKKQIIIINDGSHDQTLRLLQVMFQLKRTFPTSQVFTSITNPELMVLDASRMGKAEALNFGVKHAKYDLICTMDADTIPDLKGVQACLREFAGNKDLISAGGVIQVLNSTILKENLPVPTKTARLISFQRIEYLRTFLCERLGWGLLDSTLLISGAFCMVKKEALEKIGGFNKDSITEDFDLIVRLRRANKGLKNGFVILPVTTCYTQVPMDMKHLMVQRMRWQIGLVVTLYKNLGLLFHPRYGTLGVFAVPYFWAVEIFSPFVEALAWILIPYALYQNWIGIEIVATYLCIGLFFNLVITLLGIYLDNCHVSRRRQWNAWKIAFDTVLLHLGYKQITSWWRLVANLKALKKSQVWGANPRKEITHQLP